MPGWIYLVDPFQGSREGLRFTILRIVTRETIQSASVTGSDFIRVAISVVQQDSAPPQ